MCFMCSLSVCFCVLHTVRIQEIYSEIVGHLAELFKRADVLGLAREEAAREEEDLKVAFES